MQCLPCEVVPLLHLAMRAAGNFCDGYKHIETTSECNSLLFFVFHWHVKVDESIDNQTPL